MKKLLLLLVAAASMAFVGCGVTSVAGGHPDQAAVYFVSTKSFDVTVDIDGKKYDVETIKQKPHRKKRNEKRIANEQIVVSPGKHDVKVTRDGKEIYSKQIFISATEVRMIEL